jgi:fatty acid synthase subunit alpha
LRTWREAGAPRSRVGLRWLGSWRYIKHFDGHFENGSPYVGWVESESGKPVNEKDAKSKFEVDILAHADVRFIGKKLTASFRPILMAFAQRLARGADMIPRRKFPIELAHHSEPMQSSEADAGEFKNEQ